MTAERIRLLVDDSHEIAFRLRLGPEPTFEYVSAATARILGFPSARFYEEPRFALDHIHPEDRDIALDLRTRNNGLAPVRWLHPDGSIVWLEPRMRSLHDHDGRVIALEGVVRDVSERVEAEERRQALDAELQERQRFDAIARLAGGIAHDFNNLLLAVRGYGETALLRLQADESGAAPYVQEMLAAAERAAELTRQLLAFSRRQLLNPQVLDLNEVVGQMEGPLRRMLGPDVELAVLSCDEPVLVKADRSQLEQVLANLAVNARDAMERRGRLTIELAAVRDREPSAEVARTSSAFGVLTVKDCGVGMDAETTARIFDPFFTTKGAAGTGLGLSTVHGIVTQSGGRIAVRSRPGFGSTFEIYLPLSDDACAEAAAALRIPSSRGSETILVVEDEPMVRSIVRRMLEDRGYFVIDASSGNEAIDMIERAQVPIDLVLSDLVMRGLDGRQMTERIRALRPETKVLYMSGYTDDRVIRDGELPAGTGFIEKPFSGEELGRRLRALLGRRNEP